MGLSMSLDDKVLDQQQKFREKKRNKSFISQQTIPTSTHLQSYKVSQKNANINIISEARSEDRNRNVFDKDPNIQKHDHNNKVNRQNHHNVKEEEGDKYQVNLMNNVSPLCLSNITERLEEQFLRPNKIAVEKIQQI